MNFIVGLLGIAVTGLMIALVSIGPILLLRATMKRKNEVAARVGQTLAQLADSLFDKSSSQLRMMGTASIVEGRRNGEPVELKVQLQSTGRSYSRAFAADTTVTMSLRGAHPVFKLTQKDKLATYFSDRFQGDVESPLLDDETKEAIMDFAVRVPMVERIEVTTDGISIQLPDGPMQPTPEASASIAKDIERTVGLAEVLQKRILRALETRVVEEAHVRVDAYREALPREDEGEEEEAKAREA